MNKFAKAGVLFSRLLSCSVLLVFASMCAHAGLVTFDSYTPTDTCSSAISSEGLTFTGGSCLSVWTGNPNGNGTPSLIQGGGDTVITDTLGGAFDLNSFQMTISWYDSNPSEVLALTANFNGGGTANQNITLIQGLQTYTLNLDNVSSVDVGAISGGYWLMDNVNFGSVPEPGTITLLACGLIGLAVGYRRKLV